jgi:3-deoxy-manno-octulosonate cytidylyltransferase (CMP-KDO synthetase)
MKIAAFIPARADSTRLPNKMLAQLGQHSVIVTTYLNAVETKLFDTVWCITDSQEIATQINVVNGIAKISTQYYDCGTDRIAAFANEVDADIIINIQGDEPFIEVSILQQIIACFADENVHVASVKMPIDAQTATNPNVVKVIVDANNDAILFSRSIIPYNRDNADGVQYYKHIGIYAFRKQALQNFATLPQPDIEKIEKLENLRFIHHGIKVRMVQTITQPIGIDTQADLEAARLLINKS